MTPPQKMPYALVHVPVYDPIRLVQTPVAEVVLPASQLRIEAVANFLPAAVLTRSQHIVNPLLESLDRLLGRAGCQVWLAGFPPVARPKSIAQEIEAFLLGIPDTGLLLVQSQAQPSHHRLRPRSRFLRFSAAEDHEIVRIIDDVRPILLSLPLSAPVLQKPVHVQVGQQRAGHPSLGCAFTLTTR